MKKVFAIFALLCLICVTVNAQKTATWKGGTPGKPTDWSCPTNWKEGRVPNEFSNVVIPDVSTSTWAYPVIEEGVVEIFSLQCAPNARLDTRGNARVILLDVATSRNEGVAQSRSRTEHLVVARN